MQTEPPTTAHDSNLQYDRTNDRYVTHYDPDGTATLTTTVVHALATVADADVSQGEFSLYDSIDPDALERLFAAKSDGSKRQGGHVAFTALDHEVYVYASGDVFIYPPARASPDPANVRDASH